MKIFTQRRALPVSRALRLLAVLAAATAPAGAQSTIRVPADQPTIQLAIDAAVNGDTVLVADGRYEEALDLLGKAIEVRSENGAATTTVDGGGQARYVVTFAGGEGASTRLAGFTVTGGRGRTFFDPTPPSGLGGGLRIDGASPTLEDLLIEGNSGLEGGGVALHDGQPRFERVVFRANESNNGGGLYSLSSQPTLVDVRFESNIGLYGGAVHAVGGSMTITGATFELNDARDFGGALYLNHVDTDLDGVRCEANGSIEYLPHGAFTISVFGGGGLYATSCFGQVRNSIFQGNFANAGGGVYLAGGSTVTVVNSLIADNFSGIAGGAVYFNGSSAPLVNCTIVNNSPSGLFTTYESFPTVRNCVLAGNQGSHGGDADIQGNGRTRVEWSIAAAPLLWAVDLGPGVEITDPLLDPNFAPLAGSPLIDSGDNTAVPVNIVVDLAGNPRFVDDPASPDRGVGVAPIVDIGAFELQVAPLSVISRSCTAKITSEGRVPRVEWSGWPNVGGAFSVRLEEAIANSPAFLFFGPDEAFVPLHGGWICVGGPLTRMPLTMTSAARQAEVVIPMHAALVGDTHHYQWCFRDVQSEGGMGLSDALGVHFQP